MDSLANQEEGFYMDQGEEEEEDDEKVELAVGPLIPDPFANQHNYISWK
jgi:hypothetical protein